MSGPKDRDEQEALKLDECFKAILERLRPYILGLKVDEDNHLCRIWIEKLSRASSQRSLRNRYLLELARHLKSGHIGGIFGKPPQNGPLAPLPRIRSHTINASSSLSELSDTSSAVSYECSRKSSMQTRNKTPPRHRSIDSATSISSDYPIADSPAGRLCERIKTNRSQLVLHRQRIDSTTAIVKELQMQNERLKRDLLYARENCVCKENSDNLRSTIQQLTGEITALRSKLLDVQNMKDQLERNHVDIVEQYKITMSEEVEELNAQLRDEKSKNAEFDEKVAAMNARLEDIIAEKENEVSAIQQKCREQIEAAERNCTALLDEKKEELLLKDDIISDKDAELDRRDNMRREEIESLSNNIHELEEKLRMKNEDERKLQSFIKEQCNTMKEDFIKMREEMEVSSQTQNHNLLKKISALKRVILRLEESKEKLGIDCAKKISQVLETKELEIRNLQLRLQEQRSELSTSLSSEKQLELERLVTLLEERYKGLLSATDANAGNQRKAFLKRITILENQMTRFKHSLEFDSESTVV